MQWCRYRPVRRAPETESAIASPAAAMLIAVSHPPAGQGGVLGLTRSRDHCRFATKSAGWWALSRLASWPARLARLAEPGAGGNGAGLRPAMRPRPLR